MDTKYVLAGDRPRVSDEEIRELIDQSLAGLRLRRVLVVPPDMTRLYAYAGPIVQMIHDRLTNRGVQVDVLPALGSHLPMTPAEIDEMYPGVPHERFLVHDWRRDAQVVGEVPAEFVAAISEGRYCRAVPVEINRRLLAPGYDLILSVGQVVPHEVVGMANYNKNLFVGCGGNAMISASHFIGALYGMERIMGRDNTPAHRLFDYAQERFLPELPVRFLLTVNEVRGEEVFVQYFGVGRRRDVFERAIAVSRSHNITRVERPAKKVVAYLDPREFRSLWVCNKAVYRTRMMIGDGGELLVLAPGLAAAGEDAENDREIRRVGYRGREEICRLVEQGDALADNLSVAAHLIHGSSDGRFSIRYAPGKLTRDEVEGMSFGYADLKQALSQYDPAKLHPGWQSVRGEEIYYIPNPATGLWTASDLEDCAAPVVCEATRGPRLSL